MENILSVALDLWPGTLKGTVVGYSALHPLVADHKDSEDRRKGVSPSEITQGQYHKRDVQYFY